MAEMISIFAYRVQPQFGDVFRSLKNWISAKQTRDALHKLSARELEDIGLERCDIDRIAFGKTH